MSADDVSGTGFSRSADLLQDIQQRYPTIYRRRQQRHARQQALNITKPDVEHELHVHFKDESEDPKNVASNPQTPRNEANCCLNNSDIAKQFLDASSHREFPIITEPSLISEDSRDVEYRTSTEDCSSPANECSKLENINSGCNHLAKSAIPSHSIQDRLQKNAQMLNNLLGRKPPFFSNRKYWQPSLSVDTSENGSEENTSGCAPDGKAFNSVCHSTFNNTAHSRSSSSSSYGQEHFLTDIKLSGKMSSLEQDCSSNSNEGENDHDKHSFEQKSFTEMCQNLCEQQKSKVNCSNQLCFSCMSSSCQDNQITKCSVLSGHLDSPCDSAIDVESTSIQSAISLEKLPVQSPKTDFEDSDIPRLRFDGVSNLPKMPDNQIKISSWKIEPADFRWNLHNDEDSTKPGSSFVPADLSNLSLSSLGCSTIRDDLSIRSFSSVHTDSDLCSNTPRSIYTPRSNISASGGTPRRIAMKWRAQNAASKHVLMDDGHSSEKELEDIFFKPRHRQATQYAFSTPRSYHSDDYDDTDDTDPRLGISEPVQRQEITVVNRRQKKKQYVVKRPQSTPLFGSVIPVSCVTNTLGSDKKNNSVFINNATKCVPDVSSCHSTQSGSDNSKNLNLKCLTSDENSCNNTLSNQYIGTPAQAGGATNQKSSSKDVVGSLSNEIDRTPSQVNEVSKCWSSYHDDRDVEFFMKAEFLDASMKPKKSRLKKFLKKKKGKYNPMLQEPPLKGNMMQRPVSMPNLLCDDDAFVYSESKNLNKSFDDPSLVSVLPNGYGRSVLQDNVAQQKQCTFSDVKSNVKALGNASKPKGDTLVCNRVGDKSLMHDKNVSFSSHDKHIILNKPVFVSTQDKHVPVSSHDKPIIHEKHVPVSSHDKPIIHDKHVPISSHDKPVIHDKPVSVSSQDKPMIHDKHVPVSSHDKPIIHDKPVSVSSQDKPIIHEKHVPVSSHDKPIINNKHVPISSQDKPVSISSYYRPMTHDKPLPGSSKDKPVIHDKTVAGYLQDKPVIHDKPASVSSQNKPMIPDKPISVSSQNKAIVCDRTVSDFSQNTFIVPDEPISVSSQDKSIMVDKPFLVFSQLHTQGKNSALIHQSISLDSESGSNIVVLPSSKTSEIKVYRHSVSGNHTDSMDDSSETYVSSSGQHETDLYNSFDDSECSENSEISKQTEICLHESKHNGFTSQGFQEQQSQSDPFLPETASSKVSMHKIKSDIKQCNITESESLIDGQTNEKSDLYCNEKLLTSKYVSSQMFGLHIPDESSSRNGMSKMLPSKSKLHNNLQTKGCDVTSDHSLCREDVECAGDENDVADDKYAICYESNGSTETSKSISVNLDSSSTNRFSSCGSDGAKELYNYSDSSFEGTCKGRISGEINIHQNQNVSKSCISNPSGHVVNGNTHKALTAVSSSRLYEPEIKSDNSRRRSLDFNIVTSVDSFLSVDSHSLSTDYHSSSTDSHSLSTDFCPVKDHGTELILDSHTVNNKVDDPVVSDTSLKLQLSTTSLEIHDRCSNIDDDINTTYSWSNASSCGSETNQSSIYTEMGNTSQEISEMDTTGLSSTISINSHEQNVEEFNLKPNVVGRDVFSLVNMNYSHTNGMYANCIVNEKVDTEDDFSDCNNITNKECVIAADSHNDSLVVEQDLLQTDYSLAVQNDESRTGECIPEVEQLITQGHNGYFKEENNFYTKNSVVKTNASCFTQKRIQSFSCPCISSSHLGIYMNFREGGNCGTAQKRTQSLSCPCISAHQQGSGRFVEGQAYTLGKTDCAGQISRLLFELKHELISSDVNAGSFESEYNVADERGRELSGSEDECENGSYLVQPKNTDIRIRRSSYSECESGSKTCEHIEVAFESDTSQSIDSSGPCKTDTIRMEQDCSLIEPYATTKSVTAAKLPVKKVRTIFNTSNSSVDSQEGIQIMQDSDAGIVISNVSINDMSQDAPCNTPCKENSASHYEDISPYATCGGINSYKPDSIETNCWKSDDVLSCKDLPSKHLYATIGELSEVYVNGGMEVPDSEQANEEVPPVVHSRAALYMMNSFKEEVNPADERIVEDMYAKVSKKKRSVSEEEISVDVVDQVMTESVQPVENRCGTSDDVTSVGNRGNSNIERISPFSLSESLEGAIGGEEDEVFGIEEYCPPVPDRCYKKNTSYPSALKASKELSGSRSSLLDKVGCKFKSMKKAMSMDHGLDGIGKEEKKQNKEMEKDKGKKSLMSKAPSLKSLTAFFGRKKRHKLSATGDICVDTAVPELTNKEGKVKKNHKYLKKRSKHVLSIETVESPTEFRLIGKLVAINPDGSQMVELKKPLHGPIGFYIARGTANYDYGLLVSRFSTDNPEKLFAGILGVGDEILEINEKPVKDLTLEEVYALMAASDKLILKVFPLFARKDV